MIRKMENNRRHDPDEGYDAHEHALDSPSPLDCMAEAQPDEQDRAENQFNNNESGPGAGGRWDPDEEIDISADSGPGLPAGVGLNAGPTAKLTLEELRRRARQRRNKDEYAKGCQDELERAREEAKNGTDIEDIEPVDAT